MTSRAAKKKRCTEITVASILHWCNGWISNLLLRDDFDGLSRSNCPTAAIWI
jgi:hypothetical protein